MAKIASFAVETQGNQTIFIDEYKLLANAAHNAAHLNIGKISPHRAEEFTKDVNYRASVAHLKKKRSEKG